MKNEMTLLGTSILLLISTVSLAEENTRATNARAQQQIQMQSMSNEERALYQQLNSGGSEGGNGNMNRSRKGDGSGSGNKNQNRYGQADSSGSENQNRYGQSESSGYGSGYSSRQGNTSSGGRGRGQ